MTHRAKRAPPGARTHFVRQPSGCRAKSPRDPRWREACCRTFGSEGAMIDRGIEETIVIPIDRGQLHAELAVPADARAIVILADTSPPGSCARSGRLVRALHSARIATLCVDLLTSEEQADARVSNRLRDEVDLLADRWRGVVDYVRSGPRTRGLKIGSFARGVAAAAALRVAAERPGTVGAVVGPSARADLVEALLPLVEAPTLIVVGSRDRGLAELNRRALDSMRCDKQLGLVAGAGRFFEGLDAFADMAFLASNWFERHLAARPARTAA
jgi:pimeloyl-ACP methyl ester carboxylesterase